MNKIDEQKIPIRGEEVAQMPDLKQQAIFKAAEEVFATKGFERATMDEIAVKAKVAKGTLFYRFKSKDELFLTIVRYMVKRFIDILSEGTAQVTNAFKKLEKVIEIQTRASFENPYFIKMILSEGWGSHERQGELRSCLKEYLTFLQQIIDEGIGKGELRKMNSEILSTSIFGMIASASLHLLVYKDTSRVEQTIEELKAFCLKGILPSAEGN